MSSGDNWVVAGVLDEGRRHSIVDHPDIHIGLRCFNKPTGIQDNRLDEEPAAGGLFKKIRDPPCPGCLTGKFLIGLLLSRFVMGDAGDSPEWRLLKIDFPS